MRFCLLLLTCLSAAAADSLIDLAQRHADPKAIEAAILDGMKPSDLTRSASEGDKVFFAARAAAQPKLLIDEKPGPAMTKAGDFLLCAGDRGNRPQPQLRL